ncbi:MAG: ABC transporter permease [Anaeromyxobacter sp.]
MTALLGGLRTERALLRRERSLLLVLLAIPLLYPVLVGWVYSPGPVRERPALLVDLDGSALSRRLALDLEASPDLAIVGRPSSLEEGVRALRRDEAEVLVVLPADLSAKVKRGEPAQVAAWTGGANLFTWGAAYPAVVASVTAENRALLAHTLSAAGLPPEAAARRAAPVAIGERLLANPAMTYGRYVVPGVLLVVLQQAILISLAFSAGLRREAGLPFGPGPRPGAWLAGLALTHAPFWLGGVAFSTLGLLPFMGWAAPNPWAATGVFVAFALAQVPMGLLVAPLARTRMDAFALLAFLSAALFATSGFTWPAGELPLAVRAVVAVFPATSALRALRIVQAGGALRDVALHLAWLAGLAGAWSAALAAALRVRGSSVPASEPLPAPSTP